TALADRRRHRRPACGGSRGRIGRSTGGTRTRSSIPAHCRFHQGAPRVIRFATPLASLFAAARMKRLLGGLSLVLLSFGLAHPALAETIQVDLSDNLGLTDHVVQIVALVTILS